MSTRVEALAGVDPIAAADGVAEPERPAYPAVPIVLTGAFSLYVLVWFLEFGQRVDLFAAIRLEFLLGTALLGCAAAAIASRPESNSSRLTKYICIYFLFLMFHLPLSDYPAISWDAFVNWIVKYACMALFIYAFVRSPRTLRIFMVVLLLAFMKVGQEAFFGKITGSMVWENQGIMRLYGAPGSRFGHPNSLSGYAASMVPFLYYLFPAVRLKWKLCLLLLVVFAINILLFTGSRTGYLTVIALSGFFWLRSSGKIRFLAVLLIVAAIGVPFIPKQYEERFLSAFVGEEAEGHSKEARMELAQDAWNLFVDNPQGLGIYAFRYARADRLDKEQYDTHNLYLQAMVDIGLIGSVVFVLLVFAIGRELRWTIGVLDRQEKELRAAMASGGLDAEGRKHLADVRFVRATAAACLAFVFGRLVLGLFGHDLYEVYWWLAGGVSMAIVNMLPVVEARTALYTGVQTPPDESAVTGSLGASVAHAI